MKKLLLLMTLVMFLPSCFNLTTAGFGFKSDPGLRIYRGVRTATVHVTYKNELFPPNYKDIAPIIKMMFGEKGEREVGCD